MYVYVLSDNIVILVSDKELAPRDVLKSIVELGYFEPIYYTINEILPQLLKCIIVDEEVTDPDKLTDKLVDTYIQTRFIEGVYKLPDDKDSLHKHLCTNLTEYKGRKVTTSMTELDISRLKPNELYDIRRLIKYKK